MKKILISIFAVFFLLIPYMGNAAQLILSSKKESMAVGQRFELEVTVNSDNLLINAVEGQILFPSDLLRLVEIRDSDTFVSFWIERPRQTATNIVSFSGIAPGGYHSINGPVFKLVFETINEGSGNIRVQNERILLNDGAATDATRESQDWSFNVDKDEVLIVNQVVEIIDRDAPEIFTPILTRTVDIAPGQYILIFSTTDKGSGIDHYEVKEGDRPYAKVDSPYLVQNQKIDEDIYVKAVDKAGNERVVKVEALTAKPWYEKNLFSAIIGVVILVFLSLIFWRVSWKLKQKQRKK